MSKKTLVLGASPNPDRYGFKATAMLREYEHPVIPFGLKPGRIAGVDIVQELPNDIDLDTITLYLGPANQVPYYDYILKQKPKRVIFNPGTENPELQDKLKQIGVTPVIACTLVMLRTGQF